MTDSDRSSGGSTSPFFTSEREKRYKRSLNKSEGLGCQWPTPIILVSQEAEIGRMWVHSQPRQIVHEILSQKYSTQKRVGSMA
jgi:hypothetical protein